MIYEKTVYGVKLLFSATRGNATAAGSILKERYPGLSLVRQGLDGFWEVSSRGYSTEEVTEQVQDVIRSTILRFDGYIISD